MSVEVKNWADLTRRRWLSWLLATSLGATLVSFLYPALRFPVPPTSTEPSLSEVELEVKPSRVTANSGRIVPFAGEPRTMERR